MTHRVLSSFRQTRSLNGLSPQRQRGTAAYMISSPPRPPAALDLYGEQVFLYPPTQYFSPFGAVLPYQVATPLTGTPLGVSGVVLGPADPVSIVSPSRSETT